MRIWWWRHAARIISLQKIYGLDGLEPHIVEISGDVTDAGQTNDKQGKIELLSQWMLEAEFRNKFHHILNEFIYHSDNPWSPKQPRSLFWPPGERKTILFIIHSFIIIREVLILTLSIFIPLQQCICLYPLATGIILNEMIFRDHNIHSYIIIREVLILTLSIFIPL